MGEERLHGRFGIIDEGLHLLLLVALSHIGNMYAARGVGCLLQGEVRGAVALADMVYQNVCRNHRMCERGHNLAAVVAQVDGDVDGVFRHGYQEHILEAFLLSLSLVVRQPFLEKGGERVAVDGQSCAMVAHGDLPVPLHRQFCQPFTLTVPSRTDVELVYIDVLSGGIARERVVESECLVGEIVVKCLCACREAGQGEDDG